MVKGVFHIIKSSEEPVDRPASSLISVQTLQDGPNAKGRQAFRGDMSGTVPFSPAPKMRYYDDADDG